MTAGALRNTPSPAILCNRSRFPAPLSGDLAPSLIAVIPHARMLGCLAIRRSKSALRSRRRYCVLAYHNVQVRPLFPGSIPVQLGYL